MTDMISIDELLAEAKVFLDATVPALSADDEEFVWGKGSDAVNVLDEVDREHLDEVVAAAKAYASARYDAGFGWLDGPVEYGGRGLTTEHAIAYAEFEGHYALPNLSILTIALGFVGPALRSVASTEICTDLLPKLYRGDLIMCQLFSEPDAGSDLASATTRAVRDGDEWSVTGQKVWTSGAHAADIGICVCRTDPDVPKHRGITTFLVDMHAQGVEVRPLVQMTGDANFNEVFLSEVRVPDSMRVGDVNSGFGVILTVLGNERSIATRAPTRGGGLGPFGRLVGVVREYGDPTDPITRQRLARIYSAMRIKELMNAQWRASLKPGETPGPGMMLQKIGNAAFNRDLVALLGEVLGPRLIADTGEWGSYAWANYVLSTPGMRIGGGTEEIVRNTIGERVLGLPREPKA